MKLDYFDDYRLGVVWDDNGIQFLTPNPHLVWCRACELQPLRNLTEVNLGQRVTQQ